MISPRAQRGFSLVASIFLVVVVAMIAGFMVNIGTLQQAETTLGLMGLRANAAAGSGMEWALARVLAANSCPAPGTAFALPGSSLAGFAVTLDCSAHNVTEGARSYLTFRVVATARYGQPGREDFFQRSLVASIANPPP